jgi:hypothetical protein
MSKEGPKAPLWPEGISKVRPVENQRTKALTEGVPASVAKQPELNKQGEQEINSIIPSYIRRWDSNDREGVSYKLVPDREFLEEMGWDNFAELSLDLSSLLPKPHNPLYKPDYRARKESQWLSEHSTAEEWESSTIRALEAAGSSHLVSKFKQDMQEYRKAVKATVQLWREQGLL